MKRKSSCDFVDDDDDGGSSSSSTTQTAYTLQMNGLRVREEKKNHGEEQEQKRKEPKKQQPADVYYSVQAHRRFACNLYLSFDIMHVQQQL